MAKKTKAAKSGKGRKQQTLPAEGMAPKEVPELSNLMIELLEMGSEMGKLRQELGGKKVETLALARRLIEKGMLTFDAAAYDRGEKVKVYSFTDDSGDEKSLVLSKSETFSVKSKRTKQMVNAADEDED